MSAPPAVVVPQDEEKQLTVWSKSSELCDDLPSNKLDKVIARLGDDITRKVRKPYTITKQRERWTEEEHERFLEALKLYGRAWHQIKEHVGTKTAVQIRSHAQKFFSKLEREGSSGSLKGPISEIDIPPPRPKRRPAHPYPRKGVALNSHCAQMQLRSPLTLGRKPSGCGISLNGNDAAMEAKNPPASNTPDTSDHHPPINFVSEKASSTGFSQQPRKRGTEEVQCDAFPNESQETAKLSRSTCAEEPELSASAAIGVVTPQPESLPCNNIMPFGMYGPQMALPYYHPMHSLAAFPNAASYLSSFSHSPCELGKLVDAPNLASLIAAHAQLSSSLMPWLNQNPFAIAAAAAAAATTPWTGLGPPPPPPPPIHLPLRPPSDRLNVESPSTVAAAITAAAVASFADTSAWLAFHRAFTHPPDVRSLFKPNPMVNSALTEGQQQQVLANSSEGSKNGATMSEQTSSEEHDASTVDGTQETAAHTNQTNLFADDNSLPSAAHSQSNFFPCEEEALKNQENRGHSSTENSCNVKKDNKRGLPGNGPLVESANGLQNTAYITMNGKTLGRLSTNISSDQSKFSPSMYEGSNSPKSCICPQGNEGNGKGRAYKGTSDSSLIGEGCAYKGKVIGSLDAFTTSVHVIDCTLEEQSGSSAGKSKDCMAPERVTNTANMDIQVEIDVSMQHENGWSHKRHEYTPGEEVSKARQCMSGCGSTEDKKDKMNNSALLSSKRENVEMMHECQPDHHIDDSGSEIIPCEKAGKLLVQACLKRRQGGKIMLTHPCTNPKSTADGMRGNSACRAEAKDKFPQHRESVAIGLINGNKKGPPLIQSQSLNGSKASSSGSSKYSGHGFVPYRRD